MRKVANLQPAGNKKPMKYNIFTGAGLQGGYSEGIKNSFHF